MVYWPGLSGPLLLDDWDNLREWQRWVNGQQSGWQVIVGNNSGPLGRPVSMASFVLSASVMGPSVWALKLSNLILHVLCSVLVFLLTARLFQGAPENGPSQRMVAAIVASLWLLHPLQVSTVLYAVQRMTQLSTLFLLAGLYAYLTIRDQVERLSHM